MRIPVILLFIFTVIACQREDPHSVAPKMKVFKDREQSTECRAHVYFFLQPDCPLSQNQTRTLADIAQDDRFMDFCFTAFFSGSLYEREEYEYFILHYPTPYLIRLDPELEMANSLGATVVPEVFVVNTDGEILYEGAINDWAVREGSKRQSPAEHYLLNALLAIAEGEKPAVAKTTAVGCILE